MRVRMIRPAYWTDVDLQTRLTAEQREFYIGLWMEADDAGYLAWDVDRIGADLYPYRSLKWRRDRLPRWVEALGDHVELLACGRHARIPTLPKYQQPPKPSDQHRRQHQQSCPLTPGGTTLHPVGPAQGFEKERDRKGREGEERAGADAPSEFKERMSAAGYGR